MKNSSLVKKYSRLAAWYSNPSLNGYPSTPEEGSKKASEEQPDEFFQQQYQESVEAAKADLVKEFNKNKLIAIYELKNPTQLHQLVTKSSRSPDKLQCTFFSEGQPISHSEYSFSKAGLLKCIEEESLYLRRMRKDIPEWALLGQVKPFKTFYKLKLRDIGPGTVPEGFVETRGNRTVVYDRLLSSDEINRYELEPLGYEDSHDKFEG